jgi:hypothetical protein
MIETNFGAGNVLPGHDGDAVEKHGGGGPDGVPGFYATGWVAGMFNLPLCLLHELVYRNSV